MKKIKLFFQYAYRDSPKEVVLLTMKSILDGILPSIQIYMLAQFIDGILRYIDTGVFHAALPLLLSGFAALAAYNWMTPKLSDTLEEAFCANVRESFYVLLNGECSRIRYELLEQQKTQDMLNRLLKDPDICFKNILQSGLSLVVMMIQIVGILCLTMTYSVVLGGLLVILMIPLFGLAVQNGRVTYEADRNLAEDERKSDYYTDVLTKKEYVYERHIFGYQDYVLDKWSKVYGEYVQKSWRAFLKYFLKVKLYGVLITLLVLVMVLFLALGVLKGTGSVGFLMAVTGYLISLVKISTANIVPLFKTYINNIGRFMEYRQIFEMEKEDGDTEQMNVSEKEDTESENRKAAGNDRIRGDKVNRKFDLIEFKHVAFSYPAADIPVLKDVSFQIRKGDRIAIVGKNGAGKSTIIKLLCGLYSDYKGEILIDGKELREYSRNQIRSMSSVVFQSFAKYGISVRENIMLGNDGWDASGENEQTDEKMDASWKNELTDEKIDASGENKLTDEKIDASWENKLTNDKMDTSRENELTGNDRPDLGEVIRRVGLEQLVQQLPQKEDTPLLYFEKGGTDISGGQWQRIAIARTLASEAPLRILDEMAASLDPVSEIRMYQEYEALSQDKTAVYITHRLGSVRFATRILVLDEGQIAEEGTHDKLLENNGIYAEMYLQQKEMYQ